MMLKATLAVHHERGMIRIRNPSGPASSFVAGHFVEPSSALTYLSPKS